MRLKSRKKPKTKTRMSETSKNEAIETSESAQEIETENQTAIEESRDTKMPPKSSRKSTPKFNPISKRRLTRSAAAEVGVPEPSPDAPSIPEDLAEEIEAQAPNFEEPNEDSKNLGGVAEVGESMGSVEAENGHLRSEEADLGEEGAVDDEKLEVGVKVEEENVDFAVEGDGVDLDGEAVEDKDLTVNGECNVEASESVEVKNSNGVDGEKDGDAAMMADTINGKVNFVKEEFPAADTEDMKTVECIYDISDDEEVGAEEEESGNSEDDGEDENVGDEESEDNEDNIEGIEDDGDCNAESEDNEGNNVGIEVDERPSKSIDDSVPEKRRQKGLEIHIGGLDQETVEDDLIEVFGRFGEVLNARIIRNKPKSRRFSRGFAFIQYATAEQAKNVVAELKDGIEVKGKRVKVSATWEDATLFMDNICKSWTKEQVLDALRKYGIEHIEEVRLPNDPKNEGQIEGFALLEFSTHVDAVAAHQRLRKPGAVFGCDRSVKVAFMRSQVDANEDLSQIRANISKGGDRLQKGMVGGFEVNKSGEESPKSKTKGAEKEREKTKQDRSVKNKDKGTGRGKQADSEEKRKRVDSKITGSESSRRKSSVTENRAVGVSSKSNRRRGQKRKQLPLPLPRTRDDRGKRVEHGHDNRPSKRRQGNRQSPPRNAVRSPRRNPRARERPSRAADSLAHRVPYTSRRPEYISSYAGHDHSALSGSKRLRSDMEPHAGYVKPASLKEVHHHAVYREHALASPSKRHAQYHEPALGSQHQRSVSYLEPALGNIQHRHVRYLEPSLRREAQPHGEYLEPTVGIQRHGAYYHGLRRDGGYNDQVGSGSTSGGVSSLPSSYVLNPSYRSYGGYEVDSRRVGGYRHISQSYLSRR